MRSARRRDAAARAGPRSGSDELTALAQSLAEGSPEREGPATTTEETLMIWTLEVVWVPVSDVDRAKAFYAEQLGFNVDHDTQVNEGNRIVQLTPPGSGCSIVIGEGTIAPDVLPGSLKGL